VPFPSAQEHRGACWNRGLAPFQRSRWPLLLEVEGELARRRQLSNLKKGEEAPVPQNFGERGEAAEIVAEKIGVSGELVRQALWLRENAPEEELEGLETGKRNPRASTGAW